MARFLYFIPNKTRVTDSDLKDLGLAERLDHISHTTLTQRPIEANGPNNGSGVIVMRSDEGERATTAGVFLKKQKWVDCGMYWLGWEIDNIPSPADLKRDETIGGYPAVLEDGNEWMIPLARRYPDGTAIPQCKYMEGEVLKKEVVPRYKWLWDLAVKINDKFQQGVAAAGEEEAVTLSFDEAEEFDIAIKALKANYCVDVEEVSALRLLSDSNIGEILGYIIDLPAFINERLLNNLADKKKEEPAPVVT